MHKEVAKSAPVISHLLFADDCYLFAKASVEYASRILDILQIFQSNLGQQVNLNISSFFFSSPNTIQVLRNVICSLVQIFEADHSSLYLGLPNILGRNKSVIFGYLKEKIRRRMLSWEGRFLSKAGKELLKTVAQSLPSYTMGIRSQFVKTLNNCYVNSGGVLLGIIRKTCIRKHGTT